MFTVQAVVARGTQAVVAILLVLERHQKKGPKSDPGGRAVWPGVSAHMPTLPAYGLLA